MGELKSIEQVLRELEPTVDHGEAYEAPDTPLGRADYWTHGVRHPVIYFIQGDPKMPVKIGTATHVPNRLKSLQTGNHMKLTLIEAIPGEYMVEAKLHRQFKDYRLNGEWFRWVGLEPVFAELQTYAREAIVQHKQTATTPPRPTWMEPKPVKVKRSRNNWTQLNRTGRHRRRSRYA